MVMVLMVLAGGLLPLGCGKNLKNPTSPTVPSGSSGTPSFSFGTFFGENGTDPLQGPWGIGVSGATLWVVNNNAIEIQGVGNLQAWTTSGTNTLTITGYNGSFTGGGFNYPGSLGIGPDNFVYVGDGTNSSTKNTAQVVEFTPNGSYVTVFGNTELSNQSVSDGIGGLAIGQVFAYLGDATGKIFRYSVTGSGQTKTFTYLSSFGINGPGTLGSIIDGLCLDGSGNVYAGDANNNRVVRYDPAGNFQSAVTFLNQGYPLDVAVDSLGNIYATVIPNSQPAEIQVFSPSGAPITQFGSSILAAPRGITLDAAGNLFVADISFVNSEIYMFQKK
jgi:sugar lactone lactonase YvrE